MKAYERLGACEREEISRQVARGAGIRALSRYLGRSASTISRELRRYSTRTSYRAVGAERKARFQSQRRRLGHRKLFKNQQLQEIVHEKIKRGWSPEQIACHLKKTYDSPLMQISKESIYSYIYVLPRGSLKKELIKGLRQEHKRRYRKHHRACVANPIEAMLSIEARPKEVEDRIIPGHWEGDLIIGRSATSAMGTLVERTTRTVILVPLKNKTAEHVRKAFARELKKFPEQMRLSLTYDQGPEMREHRLFTQETKMRVYFAHPKSPWERGTNENTNGLIRQYFPKGTNFKTVTRKQMKHAQNLLNERPRKTLNWDSPLEAMQKLLQ